MALCFLFMHTSYFYLSESELIMSKESDFQRRLIRDIKQLLPGCVVLKNDANYIQGIPDLMVLYRDRWAALECKRCKSASHQPNQDDYVAQLNEMSFSRFVYPENKEEVLNDLQRSFQVERSTRVSGSE